MSATITNMEFKFADVLKPDQLMPGDVIKLEDDLLEVVKINNAEEGIEIITINEFGEQEENLVSDDLDIHLFVFDEN